MISFNDQILRDEGKYCIQVETDCNVTVTEKLSKDVVYLNREAIG